MKKILVLAIIISVNLMSCEKSKLDELAIKQLKIDLYTGGSSQSTSNSEGQTYESKILYKNFNIKNYQGCDSIVFVASLKTYSGNNRCYLELYNLTDDTAITNSILSTYFTNLTWIESPNLFDSFTEKDIDLTLKLRTEKQGVLVSFRYASIYIYF
jgi:hypothetical protein